MAPKKNYTPSQMAQAIEAVKKGEKIATAANKYGVPRITLYDKISGKTPAECSMGPSTYLSMEEENILEKWVLDMAEKHIPITRDELLDSVQRIIIDQKRKTPFTDNRPGRKWYNLFLKRHPALSERTAQNLTTARDAVTEENIKKWFKEVETYIQEKNLKEASEDPKRIFNTDESAFYLNPKAGKVLAKKGDKHIYQSSGDEKDNLTVLITGNAAGQLAPTMVVYAYERVPSAISAPFPKEWGIGRSPSGWMCGPTFFEYIANKFNPWLVEQKIKKPVLFFLDGHRSHLTLHLSNFCAENGIEIIALYPNSTHILQPMDLAVFRPLKVYWRKAVKDWKLQHLGQNLNKETFAPVLKTALQSITESSIKNGFRAGGLYPFGPDYVDLTKIKSRSRSTQQISTEQINFFNYLEKEIVAKLGAEKMQMFKELFYKGRDELDSRLNEEDLSLYVIWASNKQEVERLDHVNEQSTSSESVVEVSNSQVNEDDSSVTNTRSDNITSQTQQMSQEQFEFNQLDRPIDHDYIQSNPLKVATIRNNSASNTSTAPTEHQETRAKSKTLDLTAIASNSCVLTNKPDTTAVAIITCTSIHNPIPIATASTLCISTKNIDPAANISTDISALTKSQDRKASTMYASAHNPDQTAIASTACASINSQNIITATAPTLCASTQNLDPTAITSTACASTNSQNIITATAPTLCASTQNLDPTAITSTACASTNSQNIITATAPTLFASTQNLDPTAITSTALAPTNSQNIITATAPTLCASIPNPDSTAITSIACAPTNSQNIITATAPMSASTPNPDSTAITSTACASINNQDPMATTSTISYASSKNSNSTLIASASCGSTNSTYPIAIVVSSCPITNNPYLSAKTSTSCASTNGLSGSISTEKTSSDQDRNPIQIISTCSQQAAEKTPLKDISRPGTSKTIQLKDGSTIVVPSPFKRHIFWPEEDEGKKGRKRKCKEKIPFVITSESWRDYHNKKDKEKREKEEQKEMKAKERERKRQLKLKEIENKKQKKLRKQENIKNKKRNKLTKKRQSDTSSDNTDTEVNYAESDDSYTMDMDIEKEIGDCEENDSDNSESEAPLIKISKRGKKYSTGDYVIIKYEGEYFPGVIENVDGRMFEISTMTFSVGNTFKWPEKKDKIWYQESDIVEAISKPVLCNKRGFYTIDEMKKYLTFAI